MTGGAFGSLIAQFFHLTGAERKTLLVAGPLPECPPPLPPPLLRCCWPWNCCSSNGSRAASFPWLLPAPPPAAARRYILGPGPLFPGPAHPAFIGPAGSARLRAGRAAGGMLSALLTSACTRWKMLSQSENSLDVVARDRRSGVGIGGLIFPQALGVGYDTIGALLQGNVPPR